MVTDKKTWKDMLERYIAHYEEAVKFERKGLVGSTSQAMIYYYTGKIDMLKEFKKSIDDYPVLDGFNVDVDDRNHCTITMPLPDSYFGIKVSSPIHQILPCDKTIWSEDGGHTI
jgi:hypothetical protein